MYLHISLYFSKPNHLRPQVDSLGRLFIRVPDNGKDTPPRQTSPDGKNLYLTGTPTVTRSNPTTCDSHFRHFRGWSVWPYSGHHRTEGGPHLRPDLTPTPSIDTPLEDPGQTIQGLRPIDWIKDKPLHTTLPSLTFSLGPDFINRKE